MLWKMRQRINGVNNSGIKNMLSKSIIFAMALHFFCCAGFRMAQPTNPILRMPQSRLTRDKP